MLESSKHTDLEMISRNGGKLRRMTSRIPTYLTDFRENPAWLPMFMLARTMLFRRAHWLTAKKVQQIPLPDSMFGNVDPNQAADELRKKGIFVGLNLPGAIRDAIAKFGRETPCFGNFDRNAEFLAGYHEAAESKFNRPIISGHHFERALDCEAVVAVQKDPLLLAIAQRYLGAQAQICTTRTWWTFPTKAASDADLSKASFKFHFDLDDWRMLKFFFYLTDVDSNSGPHVYVQGSHNSRRIRHQLTLVVGHPSEDVLSFYGNDQAITLTGDAGTGFVEDPFGFHMGTLAKRSPRLMMEIGFGVSHPSRRRYHGEPVIR